MVNCPNCSKNLESKEGVKKFCAQIGNPDLAIVETNNPKFCSGCNEYYLNTEEMVKAIVQISSELKGDKKKLIEKGIYS